jgi:PAS domain S-box-containing protein
MTERAAVLLVDDVPENLFALEAMLQRDDLDLITASSGREALELLLARPIAVAIVDVQMPEMDGFELATLMRGVERTRHVPIIFVTAGTRDRGRLFAGYEAGAVDFLYKPIDPHVLRGKVNVFVELERKQQELRRSEERFRTLVQASSQAVWRTNADGALLGDSPSFRELTGMSLADWHGERWLDFIHPEDRARVIEGWERARPAREPYAVEYRLRRPDGSYTWTLSRMAPVFDDQGELAEWIGACTDIHARKQAESLREMFVAILGHDLRSPLAAIVTATQLVLMRTSEEAIHGPLARVLSSSERMVRMIEQLLDLTRVRLGTGIVLTPVPADLRALVEQVTSEVCEGRARVRLEAHGDMRGTWDVDRLMQVVSNLARNALEHSSQGKPIELAIDGTNPDRMILRVHNHGPAIPDELRPVIFEPFRGKRHKASNGLGLGLFITDQLVRAHGGQVTFTSSNDHGTTFEVRLPRHVPTR